jgi:glycosyltransferase involved in cell wall biosynthesis
VIYGLRFYLLSTYQRFFVLMMLFWLFVIALGVQCGYALYFFVLIWMLPKGDILPATERPGVSVIICARNEAANLGKNLPVILSQQYHDAVGKPMYEVIVVNDASDDDTAKVLQELEMKYDNLWDVPVPHDAPRDMPGKKYALGKGVAHAANKWLVLIDADCVPASDTWLQRMVAPLAQGKKIVAGYGGYCSNTGLLNAFVRWETLHSFLQYSTYTMAGLPYMAVGRNMACTKETLQQAQQDELWSALPSGDDDLLVRIMGTKDNVAIVAAPEAFTCSEAKTTWREWIVQKQRHLSTGKYYKTDVKMLLGGYGVSHAVVWLAFIALLFCCSCKTVILLMAVRCLIYWTLWAVTAGKVGEKKLIFLFPAFDIGWLVYNFAFLPYITWKNKQHWK